MASPPRDTTAPSLGIDLLRASALSAIAVAQPIFDALGREPTFLAVRRISGISLLAIVALVVITPVVVLAVVEGLGHLSKTRRSVHLAVVGVLVAVIALPPLGRLGLAGWTTVAAAVVAGGIGVVVYRRWAPLRSVLTIASAGLVAFPVIFLLRPQIAPLVSDRAAATVEAPPVESDTPIVLVIFDELPLVSLLATPDRIDETRHPHFARLAGRATWFPNAVTASDFTVAAVPAILTGRRPEHGLLPTFADHPHNLIHRVVDGWPINVVEPVTSLCPEDACGDAGVGLGGRARMIGRDLVNLTLHLILPADYRQGLPPVDLGWRERWAAGQRLDRVAQVDAFLEGMEPTESGALHFLHLLIPHPPLTYLPDGRRYSMDSALPGVAAGRLSEDEDAALEIERRHLLQVGFADRLLGRVLDRLEETDLYDRSVVVVLADHGASFEAGQRRRHLDRNNGASLASVPLLIKAPYQAEGRIDPRPISTIDIVPTVSELAALDWPWEFDGRSFADPTAPGRDRIFVQRHRGKATEPIPVDPVRLARDREALLEQRIQRFGSGSDSLFVNLLRPALIGRASESLPWLRLAPFRWEISLPYPLKRLESSPTMVPAHLTGTLIGRRRDIQPGLEIAVAIDGRIATVTRIRSYARGPRRGRFSMLLDPASIAAGGSTLDLFAVGQTPQGVVLMPIPGSLEGAQRVFGVRRVPGVPEDGFYGPETADGVEFRWTDGRATLNIRLPDGLPEGLRLHLRDVGPRGTRLRLEVNGQRLVSERVPRLSNGSWERVVDLRPLPPTDAIEVTLISDSFVPSAPRGLAADAPRDERRLGVAVRAIELLEHLEPAPASSVQ